MINSNMEAPRGLTLDWSSTSTNVAVPPKTNLFAYSELDEGSGWGEMNSSSKIGRP